MKCPRCQHENPPQAKFCLECGARVSLTCTKCRSELPAGAKFCLECGAAVASQATAEPRFTSPESYTPKYLAEKILTSKGSLEGERKQVTVLFADLKGSMELLADRDPEEARKILDPVLERMMEAVHRYEGTVNQVMGDGIMALFGAPVAHEDHAVRASYAALRMQESIKRYADEARRTHGVNVRIRVGLNSGEVVVRAIGSDLHMDYTAVGQTTHLAARMEQLADPGAIVITPETLVLVEGYVEVRSLGPVPVKGLVDPIEIFEVASAGLARTRLQAAARRGLTRFVGRDAELDQLRRAQQAAANGRGQLAAIVGEAGVGKSRLVYEFTHSHRLQGWLVLETASVSYGKSTSYLPVIELLKGYFKIQDRDELREVCEKVIGKLLALDRTLEPTLPALLALLDIPVEDPAWHRLDPVQRRQRTLDAVKALLLREAREQPLLLIFEDLHWIDGETQALLDSVVESPGPTRLLLLMNYRPEYEHRWSSKTYYSQVRLDALPTERAEELLDALIGCDPALAPLKRLLIRRGNPFFLEETVRTLVETKTLAGERGQYRLMQPVQTLQVPATVQAMLAARIDRLLSEDKRLLQVASVVGKDVPFALLQAIAGLPEEPLRRGLNHLQTAEFLDETRLYPDLEYAFKHALTHEVTYGSLLQERRRELHARIVEAIETLHQGRLGEQIERLAHHALSGQQWEKAIRYLRAAGRRARDRSANVEAVARFEEALSAVRCLSESREQIGDAIDLHLDIQVPLVEIGAYAKELEHLREAERLANQIDDRSRLARVLIGIARALRATGDATRAVEAGERGVALATQLNEPDLRTIAIWRLAQARWALAQFGQAVELLLPLAQVPVGNLPEGPAVRILTSLVFCLVPLGRLREARAYAEKAIESARVIGRVAVLTNALAAQATVLLELGELRAAIAVFEQSIALHETWRIADGLPGALAGLGTAQALQGRFDTSVPLMERAVELEGAAGQSARNRLYELAAVYAMTGRFRDAAALCRRVRELSRKVGDTWSEARSLRLLAEVAEHGVNLESFEVEESLRAALLLAEQNALRPLVAHCHLGLGKLYGRTGKREPAQEHLTTATAMYREMGMTYWLEKAALEIGELG